MIHKTIFFLLFACQAFGQATSGPQILILSPNQHTFEKSMDKELTKKVDAYTKGLDLNAAEEFFRSPEFKKRPENVQVMSRSEVNYLKTLTPVNLTSYLAEQHLSYSLYEKLKTVVIQLKDATSTGDLKDLKRIATEEKTAFVLNFSAIELYKEKKEGFAKLTVQLYDHASGSLLLNKSFIGGPENPGFEYACEEKSVDCCINNALSQALNEVAKLIVANDPASKKEKQVAAERSDILLNTYFTKAFDKQALKAIIPAAAGNIDVEKAYQVLFSPDKSKFVAFFLETVPANDSKSFQDSKKDRNVNIVSDDQMGFFGGKLPNTYTYIVKGVLYQGKWYYEKSQVTYFDAADSEQGKKTYFDYLQKWNFFTEGSAEVNPGFWEATGKSGHTLSSSTLFEKVADVKKDPDWEKYKDVWESRELRDRPYVGMYEIVADQLREEAEKK